MLLDGDNPVLSVEGVLCSVCADGKYAVSPRPYSSLTFRVRGNLTVEGGGKTQTVSTNDILYIPQGVGYTAEYFDNEGIVIHFVTQKGGSEIEVFSFENGEALYKTFSKALHLWKSKEPGFRFKVMGLLYDILGTLSENSAKVSLPLFFLKGVSYINQSYRDGGLSVDGVCRNAGVSATVFRRLFREHYNKTPTEYITDLRLEYARNLIASGASVDEAATASGFNDPKYFARVVKKRLGCTPRDFKSFGK